MRILLILLLILATGPAAALCRGASFLDRLTLEQSAALDAAVAETPYPTGLIFEASKGEDRLTLVGTIHIYHPSLQNLVDELRQVVRTADVLLVEATQEDATELQQAMLTDPNMMFLPDGPTLPEMLDDADWQRLADAARERQIPPFMAAKMQPWFLSVSLSIAPCAMAEMMSGRQGLDFMLMEEAADAGVPTQALEPWRYMFDIMRAAPMEEQLDSLRISVMPGDLQSEMFVAMMDSYLMGEIARVWEASRLVLDYVPDLDPAVANAMFDEMEQMLLDERNRNWIPVITEAMETADTAVVAVGAAHLPGEAGVLRLLEAEGWTITRIER